MHVSSPSTWPGPTELPRAVRVLVWWVAVVSAGLAGLVLVSLRYQEFMDCSNPTIHQSASTPFGWAVAVGSSVVPVVVAFVLVGRRWHPFLAVAAGTAGLSLLVWYWLLVQDCGWSSAPVLVIGV